MLHSTMIQKQKTCTHATKILLFLFQQTSDLLSRDHGLHDHARPRHVMVKDPTLSTLPSPIEGRPWLEHGVVADAEAGS